ncbi:hypothetical protein [Mammaliicoccus sp. J-M39]|uniref:hypothetical protein n=1 Tax=Mammaliicoccus sp. J-M39 TaxID=2898698 RepID=UPI001EFBD599|nr:hypothetical protein [Mammaliicoccus sp. J-M39]
MKYLITLTLAALTLYAFIKRTYKYASVNDEVDQVGIGEWTNKSSKMPKIKAGDIVEHRYTPENGIENRILRTEAPIDYESDQYKEAETWFSGMGRS